MYKASRSAKVRFMKSSVEWWKTCRVFGLWQACLLSGILLLSGTGFAQLSTASLSGAVRDSSGAVIANVKVVLKNVQLLWSTQPQPMVRGLISSSILPRVDM